MQCPICIVSARNTSISILSHVRLWRRSLVKSAKVVMVISVSLPHQQCYNFRKIQQETLSGLELSFIWGASLFLFPLGPPVKVCTTHLWGPQGCVHCWPDPLWKPSETLVDIELLDAWPLDVGQSGCRCDTPGLSWKSPSSSDVLSLEVAASSLSLSQTSSEIRFWDRNLRFFETPPPFMIGDDKIFSLTKGNVVKCDIIQL